MATAKDTASTGMWGKDQDFGARLDTTYEPGEHFLLLSITPDGEFVGSDGKKAPRVELLTRKLDGTEPSGVPMKVKSLATPIVRLATEQQEGDLPAIVYWQRIPVKACNNETTVLKRVCPYPYPDDYLSAMDGEAA